MFLLLTRVLLWILVGYIIYYVLIEWLTDKWRAIIGTIVIWAVLTLGFYDPTFTGLSLLWGIMSFFVKPLGLSMLLVFIGLQHIPDEKKRLFGRRLIISALVILLITSNPFISYKLAQRLEFEWIRLDQVRKEISPTVKKNAAAIVLIGEGKTKIDLRNRDRVELSEGSGRVLYAANLYRKQKRQAFAPLVIVVAGEEPNIYSAEAVEGSTVNQPAITEAQSIAILLERLGVSSGDIILETEGVNVRTIALTVEDILKDVNIKDKATIVINSALQMRRTALSFMNLGINVISKPTDFYTFQPPTAIVTTQVAPLDLVPSAEALALSSRVIEEYLGLVFYFLRGWLSPIIL
ncbi:YdcF family protein [Lusitaniella coriacea LEGE 07157]|uniref:YdcF family protein n=1 Tax=Lusitaniella coriacea LEGE 07157 TaxID=945747 RepID=A0A8J7IXR1_9CYAN|nr:ElyC/SanA/YdcF family protein [Lusitaniella coriacea]MBE9118948.1 YdcF family protein [Lusitaniella coriacea LEGE 07157]